MSRFSNPRSMSAAMRGASAGALIFTCLSGVTVFAASAQQNAQPQATPFVQHVRQAGLKACAAAYPALGQMMAGGSPYAVISSWNRKAPDAHSIQALAGLSLNTPEYKGPAAGVVLAAPSPSGCEGNAVRVVPLPQSCAAVVKELPQGSQLVRNLSGTLVYELGAGRGQLMLLSSAASCVAISVNHVG